MNGALVGFRIDGVNKLIRLHGERGSAAILCEVLQYLRATQPGRMQVYARAFRPVAAADGPRLPLALRQWTQAFLQDRLEESCPAVAWTEVFALLPDFEAWHAGFPFLPAAQLDNCGDVSWAFLINLDAHELQIFINRHARFAWRDMAGQTPFCSLALGAARKLSRADALALHEVLLFHSCSDELDPVLPTCNAESAPLPGPGDWTSQFRSAHNRIRLVLRREEVEVVVGMLGELRPDDSGCGAFLRSVISPRVLELGLAIYGSDMTLTQAARLATCMDELPFGPDASGLPLLDLALRPSSGLVLPLGPDWFDGLRGRMLAAGMSRQGWRFLMRQSAAALRALLAHFRLSACRLREFAYFTNLMASALQRDALQVDRLEAALRGVQRILDRGARQAGSAREENARVYLRCLMRACLNAQQQANLAHEAQQVADFVHEQIEVLRGRHSWQSLCRHSHDWHKAALMRISPERDLHWRTVLPVFRAGSMEAFELDSGAQLLEEGLEQRHCVGSYAQACASGACRIFSLRRDGKRLATIELRREQDGAWRLGQVRSKANAVVDDAAVLGLASKLAAACARAS